MKKEIIKVSPTLVVGVWTLFFHKKRQYYTCPLKSQRNMLKKTSKNNRNILFPGKLGLMLGRLKRWWRKRRRGGRIRGGGGIL